MDRTIWAGVGIGLAAGLVIGFFAGKGMGSGAPPMLPAPPPSDQQPMSPALALQRRIFDNRQVVEREPKNLQAWIALGHDYFDTHQPQLAIDAYAKALELEPNNPDVLTDQGVMYRELGNFDKAVANFKKAGTLNPKHVQSAFNLGVVYANDLKDKAKAIEAWKRVIAIDPMGPQAEASRKGIEELNQK